MNDVVLSLNRIEELDEVLDVAEKVFRPSREEKERYHLKSKWIERVNNGLLISAKIKKRIVGFAICYRKESDLHIWNVGVLEEFRKKGIWRKMYKEIVAFAIKNGFKSLSLNTYKKQFPGMYDFATKEGFTEYKTELDDLSGDIKSMFGKEL